MPPSKPKTIKVTVDKSHLLTLGERMYVESIELIRELVNNAYDADATEVDVTISPDKIVVEDNGLGMNERGLAQFFTIGSAEKRIRRISPRFGRKRIGQFGIGKFAALAAADRFIVESKRGKWLYSVTFDKKDWEKTTSWELPIKKELASPLRHDGTRVTLTKLRKQFSLSDVERYLKETVPLRAKKFVVFLNSKRITPRFIPGRKIPILFKTIYGAIEGEIVIAANPRLVDKPGVECRVKQALIKREFFGIDSWKYGANRICGSVNADFLPITSARTDFIKDSPEYQLFCKLMRTKLEKVLKTLKKEADERSLKKMSRALREALDKIRKALKLNPELAPSGRVMARKQKAAPETISAEGVMLKETRKKEKVKEKEEKKEKVKEKIEQTCVKRLRLKKLGITCSIAHLGEEGPEAVSERNAVYVNQDHPLYKELYPKGDLLALHLLRLITREIVLMKRQRISARQAYEMQSRLLTDAIVKFK